MSYRAGFLGLVGQPNAGKSTLMNYLVDEKVSIVSKKPQTTRRRVLGLWSNNEGQIVFVDAPGFVSASKGLNSYLSKEGAEVIKDSDALCVVLAVDTEKPEDADKTIEMVAKSGKPWMAVITKTDLSGKGHRSMILRDMVERHGGKAVSMSAKDKSGEAAQEKDELLKKFLEMLPTAPEPLYDIELFTPETQRSLAAEIIREKCFEYLHEEIPFGLAVRIIKFDEAAEPVPRLSAEILVAKDNHKGIVIGKGGEMLKQIGSEARKDIQKMMGEKIFLELNVIARKDWTDNPRMMKELGYAHVEGKNK